jgi:hypothetical protein
MNAPQLHNFLSNLSHRRPVFHSEADFQHELALEISRAGLDVRLEVPLGIPCPDNQERERVEIDLMVRSSGTSEWTAVELKYVKVASHFLHGNEVFELKETWGTNLSRFDCLADFQRVERIVQTRHACSGFSVFLTNAEDAWGRNVGVGRNMACRFSIHEGRVLNAAEAHDWTPSNPKVSSVSAKRLPPYAPLVFSSQQICKWTCYSTLAAANGDFRYLMLSACVGR